MFRMTTTSVRNYLYRKMVYYSKVNITNFRKIEVVIEKNTRDVSRNLSNVYDKNFFGKIVNGF